jgi:hypothetical protein
MVFDPARFARRAVRLSLALAAGLAAAPALAQEAPDLYTRVEARLAAEPDLVGLLGKPAPEMAKLAWLVGAWNVESFVESAPDKAAERGISLVRTVHDGAWLEVRDDYPGGTQDMGYIGYSAVAKHWTNVSIDSLGNANVATSKGWDGDKLVFEGDFLILGEKAHLRQTLTRVGPDEYHIDNEELLAGGRWKRLDRYRYTRRKPD